MTERTLERETEKLDETQLALQAWYLNRDSDSVTVQNIRTCELVNVSEALNILVEDVQSEHRIVLTAGIKPVEAWTFVKNAYDFIEKTPRTLPPQKRASLEQTRYLGGGPESSTLYVGNRILWVAVSGLAKALCEEATLSIVPAGEVGEAARVSGTRGHSRSH